MDYSTGYMDQTSGSFDLDAFFAANQVNTFNDLEGSTIAADSVPEADLNAQVPDIPDVPVLTGSQDPWMYIGGSEASSDVQAPYAELPMAEAPQESVYEPLDWNSILDSTQHFGMSGAAPEANTEPQTANIESLMAEVIQAGIYTSEEWNALLQHLRANECTDLNPQSMPQETPVGTVEAANAALNHWFIAQSSNSGGENQDTRAFISAFAQNDAGVPLAQSPDMDTSDLASMDVDQRSAQLLESAAGHLDAPLEGFRGGSVGLPGAHHDFAADARFVHQNGAVVPQNQHLGLAIDPSLIWMSFPGSNVGQYPAAQPENQDIAAQPVNQDSAEGPQSMGLAASDGAPDDAPDGASDGAPDGASDGAPDGASDGAPDGAMQGPARSSPEMRSDTTPESQTTGNTTPNHEGVIAQDAAEPAAQNAAEPNQHQEEPRRAKKTAIACKRCKERKIKCDAATPQCSCCAKAGVANCEYATAVRKRGRAKASIRNDISTIERDLEKEETKKKPNYLQIFESAQNELRELRKELSQSSGKERTKPVKASTSGSQKGKKKA